MKVVVAVDSFKGSLSSYEAGTAIRDAVLKVYNDAAVIIKPLSDGGEGMTDVFLSFFNAHKIELAVNGPLLSPINAKYCIIDDSTAVIEMAEAAGITHVSPEQRNPLFTTTYGVGEMIKDAIMRGCRNFIIGIGGSATNDGGTGMLSALGFEFLDENNEPIVVGAHGLENLCKIKNDNIIPELKDCIFNIACDVQNPLCGKNGCSYVFGPQKGGTPENIEKMDQWLYKFAQLTEEIYSEADMNMNGAGAAGGLGFAFSAYLNGTLRSGVDIILEKLCIEEDIKNSDFIVTGEGRLDSQTVMGKAPAGIAKLAKKYGKTVIAFAGSVADDAEICNKYGIDAYFPILRNITTLDEAMVKENAYKNLYSTAYQVFRLIKTGE